MEINGVTTVIRSVGERTEALCKSIILGQGVPNSNTVIVNETPFSKALDKSFSIGIENDLPWTLCIDADVLLRPNALKQLISVANKQNDRVCEVQGFVLDKFHGGVRYGGPHLYRTSLLKLVKDFIPSEGVSVRPETYALNKMNKNGYPWYSVTLLAGIHDYEQYYRDIFRKCFVYAHKYPDRLENFVSHWRLMLKNDFDYEVALGGLAAGIEYNKNVYIDANRLIYYEKFAEKNIKEKVKLNTDEYSASHIEEIIQGWGKMPENMKIKSIRLNFNGKVVRAASSDKLYLLKNKARHLGFIRVLPWLIGFMMKSIGGRICKVLEKE